jgi:hypothetical protein
VGFLYYATCFGFSSGRNQALLTPVETAIVHHDGMSHLKCVQFLEYLEQRLASHKSYSSIELGDIMRLVYLIMGVLLSGRFCHRLHTAVNVKTVGREADVTRDI